MDLQLLGDEILPVFEQIGSLRKVYTIGGEIDHDKVAELIVRDIRSEYLGKLTFDFTCTTTTK